MARPTLFLQVLPICFLPLSAALAAGAPTPPNALPFGRFGALPLAQPSGRAVRTVILLADGSAATAAQAAALAAAGALVVTVDVPRYLKVAAGTTRHCINSAAELEAVGQAAEHAAGLPAFRPPILVGTGAGATLVYAALAEAPSDTFSGAVSVGFNSWLPTKKPICRGFGLVGEYSVPGQAYRMRLDPALAKPWIILASAPESEKGPGDSLEKLEQIVARVPRASLRPIADVGDGADPLAAALLAAVEKIDIESAEASARTAPKAHEVAGLPLIELPAGGETDSFAVVYSGDGGWTTLDRRIGQLLSNRGLPVVGWNCRGYFWIARDPDGAALDLGRALDHYLAAWGKRRAILIGYSQGADVLPFLAARLPPALKAKISVIALIGPSEGAAFDFQLAGWMSGVPEVPERPVAPEIARLRGSKVLCAFGEQEKGSACTKVDRKRVTALSLPSGHAFGGEAGTLVQRILKEAGVKLPAAPSEIAGRAGKAPAAANRRRSHRGKRRPTRPPV